ncbi:MAG TPA: hypothetical protein VFF30_09620 [Nitrososphaerales archaeon]|nr:hypothetical protein [Nitrososphaerales archaeon]
MVNKEDAASTGKPSMLDQMLLDIKGLSLLNPSDEAFGEIIESTLVNSRDEDVERFLSFLKPKKSASEKWYFLMALGESILAVFLFIGGVALLSPAMIGLTSPQQLLTFFDEITSSLSVRALSNPAVPLLDFLMALGLLFAAFSTLRIAASSLKETGVSRQ